MKTTPNPAPSGATQEQFTPGPWRVSTKAVTGGYAVLSDALSPNPDTPGNLREYYQCLTVSTQRDDHPLYGGGIAEITALSNARLIAASPNMFLSLRRCLKFMDATAKDMDPLGDTKPGEYADLDAINDMREDIRATLKLATQGPEVAQ